MGLCDANVGNESNRKNNGQKATGYFDYYCQNFMHIIKVH